MKTLLRTDNLVVLFDELSEEVIVQGADVSICVSFVFEAASRMNCLEITSNQDMVLRATKTPHNKSPISPAVLVRGNEQED